MKKGYKPGIHIGEKAYAFKNRKIKYVCNQCKKEFYNFLSLKSKFCCRKCFELSHRKTRYSFCKECGKKFELRKLNGAAYPERKFCSKSCASSFTGKHKKQPIRTKEWRDNISKAQKGAKGNNWKGGITDINRIERRSGKFKAWRELVFSRDNYTCQKSLERGGKLHPHHIQNFSKFPELRYDINNGITLSEKNHILFHKLYGRNNNTQKQIEEFIGRKL